MLANIVERLIRHVETLPPVTDGGFRAEYKLEGPISTLRTNEVESLSYSGNLNAYHPKSGRRIGSANNTTGGTEVFDSVKELAIKLIAGQPYSGRFDLDRGVGTSGIMIEINYTGPQTDIPAELAEVEKIFGGPISREYHTS